MTNNIRTLLLVSFTCMLLIVVVGCQSMRSWGECPGMYSGLRYYASQVNELPWDGRVFFAIDVPFTAIADTLALPVTSFVDPDRPPGGYTPGCRWAGP